MADPVTSFAFFLVFLFSVTLHEAAHAWSARRGGDPTAYLGGQVSLNPLPHIRREPFGMLVLPLISVLISGWPFGFASAPYDPVWARAYPRKAAWMALAGPVANLALVLAAAVVIRLGVAMGELEVPMTVGIAGVTVSSESGAGVLVALVLSIIFSMNLILFLLNMVPFPPLDGSAAIVLLLPPALVPKYQEFVRQPMLGWLGILIAWRIFGVVFRPLFMFSLSLLYPGVEYG
jgi:Zn-dependent protease